MCLTGWPREEAGRLRLWFNNDPQPVYRLEIEQPTGPALVKEWEPISDLQQLYELTHSIDRLIENQLTGDELRFLLSIAYGYDEEATDRDAESVIRFGYPGQFG